MSRSGSGAGTGRLLTVLSPEPGEPVGFGSAARARPEMVVPDTPGPGRYCPQPGNFHVESVRGHGLGFTSLAPRKLEFLQGNKNPAPIEYDPARPVHRMLPRIGTIPMGRRCLCFPDERDVSLTPGPGAYEPPPSHGRIITSIFKSKTERRSFPTAPKPEPRFNGRTFMLHLDD
jgi:hypothetical protein